MSSITHNPVLPFKWEFRRDYVLGLGLRMSAGELPPPLGPRKTEVETFFLSEAIRSYCSFNFNIAKIV